MLPPVPDTPALQRLLLIMARLRDPLQGCAWDLEQTPETLAPYAIEEAYEVVDAIARGDRPDWCEELGDLLLQVVFQARVAEEQGDFVFDDVARAIGDKLIRRHPHIFRDDRLDLPRQDLTPAQVSAQWAQIKAIEKALRARSHAGAGDAGGGQRDGEPAFLDKVGNGLPPLLRAEKLQARAGEVGYDWNDPRAVIAKLREELDELEEAIETGAPQADLQDELGDVLFCCVNIGRHLKVDSEQALLGGVAKFRRRFGYIEQSLRAEGRTLQDASLDDMEARWQAAKREGL
ncbi:nucleoside triphosphate pyrophosphohydrolase [Amnimonas aquatica]|uniref:Nucleoside triphosphate pyrophosphohydrolase n=1 Tax=Amnimonas aquatica TaxID=2094561 RepID=A0A2P6AT20_9GAMM|nr:nucleoside triphosphate pyrophosphohydrolase [Amnimonas aquatica]PQA44065.1 nucleoside triphosphate pyrophosphohydrolase [Amnimonas aquatica]